MYIWFNNRWGLLTSPSKVFLMQTHQSETSGWGLQCKCENPPHNCQCHDFTDRQHPGQKLWTCQAPPPSSVPRWPPSTCWQTSEKLESSDENLQFYQLHLLLWDHKADSHSMLRSDFATAVDRSSLWRLPWARRLPPAQHLFSHPSLSLKNWSSIGPRSCLDLWWRLSHWQC